MNEMIESQNEPSVEWDKAAQNLDLRKCLAEPDPLKIIFMGMTEGTVGALVSQGGAGKTYVGLEIAVAVAGGPNLLELKIGRHGPVSFFAAEDTLETLNYRMHHILSGISDKEAVQLSKNLKISSLSGSLPDLFEPSFAKWLLDQARGRKLIVLDTLRRFHTKDENSGGDMVQLLGILESICHKTGCSILFVHHTGKAAALNDQGSMQQASRGSSVLVDNIRGGQINLVGMSPAEAKKFAVSDDMRGHYVKFCSAKQNYAAPEPDRWLGRHAAQGGILLPVQLVERERTDGKDTSTKATSKPRNSKERSYG